MLASAVGRAAADSGSVAAAPALALAAVAGVPAAVGNGSAAASSDPCAVVASGPQHGPNGEPNLSSTGLAVGGALIAIVALLAAGAAALFVRYRALGRRH